MYLFLCGLHEISFHLGPYWAYCGADRTVGPLMIQQSRPSLTWAEFRRVVPFRAAFVDIMGWAYLVLTSRITGHLSSIAAQTIWKPSEESRLL